MSSTDSDRCPHAKAAGAAAAVAQREAEKARKVIQSSQNKGTIKSFDYQTFYEKELDKKHKDK